MNSIYSPTSLQTVTNQFNIQPANTLTEKVGKIALGTVAKLVIIAFAANEWLLCTAASKILTNRAELKSRAKKASKTLAKSAKSLNRPYAPQERIVETGGFFWKKTGKEITEGPTLTQLVGNSVKETIQHPIHLVQKNPKTICIALSAASIAFYYLSQNSPPVNPSEFTDISDTKNLNPPLTYDPTNHTPDIKDLNPPLTCGLTPDISDLTSNFTLANTTSQIFSLHLPLQRLND